MHKIRDYLIRICIFHEGKIFKLFSIGYHKDGGYYISDFLDSKSCIYTANKIRCTNIPLHEPTPIKLDPEHTYSIFLKKPKISHHIDGNAHISGEGIHSGYDNGESKGLSVKSGNLHGYNDGGPMFVFHFGLNTLNKFPQIELNDKIIKKPHLIFNEECVVDLRENSDDKFCYLVEAFYIHKSDIPEGFENGMTIIKYHPFYGKVHLIPLHSPPQSPYIFGMLYVKDVVDENSDGNTFSYTGAPGVLKEDGSWDIIGLILEDENKNHPKTLNRE